MRRSWLWIQSLALAVVVTWPAVAVPFDAALGHPDGDVYKHLWTLWWMDAELWDGTPGLITRWVGWPDGMSLFPVEPLNGVLQVVLPGGPVARSNFLAIFHAFLLGLTGGWVGRLVSQRTEGGWIAGALLQVSAFYAFSLQVGVGELRQLWWLPLGLGCAVRARDTGTWPWFGALAAALAGATFSCAYMGFFLAISVAIHALLTLRVRLLPRYLLTAALAGLVVVGPVRTFTAGFAPDKEPPAVSFSRYMEDFSLAPLDTFPGASVGLDEVVRPRWTRSLPAEGPARAYEGGRYLGVGCILLAVLGAAASPRRAVPHVAIAGVGLLLSLGTVLWWGGEIYVGPSGRVVLPFAWLHRAMQYYVDPVNFPARFIAIPCTALAVLAALASRWRAAVPIAILAATDLLLGEVVGWPRTLASVPNGGGLARAPGSGAVADMTPFVEAASHRDHPGAVQPLDLKGPAARRQAIAAQIALHRPFDAIPIERLDRWAPDGFLWVEALPLASALSAGRWTRADLGAPESLWLLRDRGFDGILVTHTNFGANPDLVRALSAVFGLATGSGAGTLWSVPEAEVSDPDAVRAAHAARVAALPRPTMGVGYDPGKVR